MSEKSIDLETYILRRSAIHHSLVHNQKAVYPGQDPVMGDPESLFYLHSWTGCQFITVQARIFWDETREPGGNLHGNREDM